MKQKTYYQLILDRSGSMKACQGATISGFNEQVQMIRELQDRHADQEILLSLTTFSHEVTHPVVCADAHSVRELSTETYHPSGSTALLDAIGESVMALKQKAGKEIEEGVASVVVVIITDGEENASKLFNYNGIRTLVRELEDTGKWTFSFMGADMDAIAHAGRLNIRHENTSNYSSARTSEAWDALKDNMGDYMHAKSTGRVPKDFLKKKPRA